jgi:hypothetical protein
MVQDHQGAAEKADLVRGFGAPGFRGRAGQNARFPGRKHLAVDGISSPLSAGIRASNRAFVAR